MKKPNETILVVDDSVSNRNVISTILKRRYHIETADSGQDAIQKSLKHKPDLILLDVQMPELDGYAVCDILHKNPETKHIPIIFVSSKDEPVDEVRGFDLGGVDYITKPINAAILTRRVETHLNLANQKRSLYGEVQLVTEKLFQTQKAVINILGRAAEYKDNATGDHVKRVAAYAEALALAYGIDPREADLLRLAAPMHDVGKIGIPDAILKKPGPLTLEERRQMMTHAAIGAEIFGNEESEVLRYAKIVAKEHHEHWDGNGYPAGLKGGQIHIFARIVAIADVFDALTSKRPYKAPWTFEAAIEQLKALSGKQFDPKLVDLFVKYQDDMKMITVRYR